MSRPSRRRARSVSKACSKSSSCRTPSRRPSRRPATSRCASRAANIWSSTTPRIGPSPTSLRKVVATFRRSPPNTACLQCRLNYYNANENWLTRMFTLDYALWFDQVLPGLERLGMPIPLGGTSNHFRIDVLRELHAWDPFNVTEDADLGIRIGQKGYRVGVVDSTTYEEASCRTGQWLRQRSRWIKGYMQTLLVHTRRPLHLMRSAGPLGFLGFVFFIGGTVLAGLLNPVFWLFYVIWLVASAANIDVIFPQSLLFLCLFNLLAGNGAFTYLIMLAPIRRGWLDLIPFSFTLFGYWVLISVAAYQGRSGSSCAIRSSGKRPSTACRAHAAAQLSEAPEARHETRAGRAAPIASLVVRRDSGACGDRGAQRLHRRRRAAAVGGRQHRRRRPSADRADRRGLSDACRS